MRVGSLMDGYLRVAGTATWAIYHVRAKVEPKNVTWNSRYVSIFFIFKAILLAARSRLLLLAFRG